MKTFLSVFAHASLWLVPPVGPEDGIKNLAADMLLIGSRDPQRLDWARLDALSPTSRSPRAARGAVLATRSRSPPPGRWAGQWALGGARGVSLGTPLFDDSPASSSSLANRLNAISGAPGDRQYAAMGAPGATMRTLLSGVPALAVGGTRAAELLRALAERHVAAVQPDRALADLEAAIVANRDDAAAQERAAELLVARGRPREAQQRYLEVVRLDPARISAAGDLPASRRPARPRAGRRTTLVRLQPEKVAVWLRPRVLAARSWTERAGDREGAGARPEAPVDPQLLAFPSPDEGEVVYGSS